MKKTLFVLRTNNYFPQLCQYTLPTIKAWAKKHGWEYREITESKWPEWPATYDKMQVHELGKDSFWNLLVDADCLLHPELSCPTTVVGADHVGTSYAFRALNMFEGDRYFIRDGRNIGLAGGFVLTSVMTHELWEPLDMQKDEALSKTKRAHIVDEYCMSRNLAKYGLKHCGVSLDPDKYIVHIGMGEQEDVAERVERAKKVYEEFCSIDPEIKSYSS